MADVVINKWNQGMAESPMLGFGDIRNIDIYSQPGTVKVNAKLQLSSQTPVSTTFTVDTSSDTLIFSTPHNLYNGAAITVSSSGGLPAPLSAATTYYVIFLNSTQIRLASNLANAFAGTSIDITTTGSGTQTISTINMGQVRYFTQNPTNDYIYCVDNNGRVWYVGDFNNWVLIDGNTRTNANGNGIVIWKNYLLVFRNGLIDVYGNLTNPISSRSWTNGWTSISNTTGSHHAIWATDDILYYCNTSTVGSIQQVGTFDPANNTTYTSNTSALTLSSSYNSYRLGELGGNLQVLASIGSNANVTSAIFPWDRVSSSFFLPIELPFYVNNFFTFNNVLYLFSSNALKIFTTNGNYVSEIKRLPPATARYVYPYNSSISGVGYYQGKIIFSLFGINNYSAVYSINAQPNEYFSRNSLVIENTISTGSTASTTQVLGIHVPRGVNNYYVSWYDLFTGRGGIDSIFGQTGVPVTYSNYEASLESELLEVGTPLEKRTFSQIEVFLAKPLTASQGIKLYYRTNLTDIYTPIGTYDFSTLGAVQTFTESQSFGADTDMIQIKIELTAADSGVNSPEVKEIRLR